MKINRLIPLFILIALSLTAQAQKIAVLSDIHVTPWNENGRQLRKAVDEINAADYDLVVVDGDLTNEGSDRELNFVKDILDGIKHPMKVLPGNHENNWSQSATKTFNDLWGGDRFCTTLGNLVVVGINCGPYMKMGDGHIKQEDLHWLRDKLETMVTPDHQVLSFNHYPIRKGDIDNYIDYALLLENYPVIAHINGHYHKWDRYNADDIDAVTVRALRGGDDDYGYAIVQLDGDNLIVSEKRIGRPAEKKYTIEPKRVLQPAFIRVDTNPKAPDGFTLKKVWTDSASVFTRLAFDKNNVYFGNSLGEAKAVGKTDGQLKWAVPTGASLFSRPVVLATGNVAVPHATGIRIVSADDGSSRANMRTKEGPYVADGLLTADCEYLQGGYKRMERRDCANGKLIWSYDSIDNYCQGAPVVDGNDVIFGAWDTNLRCLDVETGRLKWKWNNGNAANMLGPGNVVPVVTADKVIIVAPDRYITALDRRTGKQLWRDNSHRYRESLGHSADMRTVYAKTMDGELVAVDATSPTFKELWICDMGIGYDHAPCIVAEVGGVIYAGSRRGILTAVSPATHKVMWQLQLGTSEINGIDIDPADGSVWVSLIEGTIYRIANR